MQDAVTVAVETIASVVDRVEEVRVVAFDGSIYDAVRPELAVDTSPPILQGVRALPWMVIRPDCRARCHHCGLPVTWRAPENQAQPGC